MVLCGDEREERLDQEYLAAFSFALGGLAGVDEGSEYIGILTAVIRIPGADGGVSNPVTMAASGQSNAEADHIKACCICVLALHFRGREIYPPRLRYQVTTRNAYLGSCWYLRYHS